MELRNLLTRYKFLHSNGEHLQQLQEGLSKIISRLKQKDDRLKQRIRVETDTEELEMLEQELDIVHFQTRKGIELLSRMRSCGKEKNLS